MDYGAVRKASTEARFCFDKFRLFSNEADSTSLGMSDSGSLSEPVTRMRSRSSAAASALDPIAVLTFISSAQRLSCPLS